MKTIPGLSALLTMFCFGVSADAQVLVPFTQRTAAATPGKVIYNIKGDYVMIGNTNLTLDAYTDTTNNSLNSMHYVDIDGDPNTLNSSSATLQFSTENGAIPSCSHILYAGLYWTGRASNGSTSPETFTVTKGSLTKTLNKRTVYLKGPSQSGYKKMVADSSNIYYPSSTDGFMYSGYIEVTDYVKQCGLGEYTLADLATIEGNGGSTGYYGGWGMIVVYENSKMKWRDVTIFDGHAYVAGNATLHYELPVTGFHTAQSGPVNLKLGLMAGEGDVGIPGDYFRIRDYQDQNWITLNHSGNTTTNFFNGSINTGGNPRNPAIKNNTGVDIAMFNIPNANNSIITNNQTSTKFQYGSTQDTYIIFCIAMAVDAYVPDVAAIISAESINGIPAGGGSLSVKPGEEIEYKLKVKNHGTEAVSNTRFSIPVPFMASYVKGSGATKIDFTPGPVPNHFYFDSLLGPTGSLVWDFGTLPLPPAGYPDSTLAELTFRLAVTKDCSVLKNPDCPPNVTLGGGLISGVGAISGTTFNNMPFIQGYQASGGCSGEPITDPLTASIDAAAYIAANCQNTADHRSFVFCNYIQASIPYDSIAKAFPLGLRFYNTSTVTSGSVEYTKSNPFPATPGTVTYYGIPSGMGLCFYKLSITVSSITSVPLAGNLIYCLNQTVPALTATPSDPSFTLNFYTSLSSQTPYPSITPSTAKPGITTYYVAEVNKDGCVSLNRDSIKVTVHDSIHTAVTPLSVKNVLCKGDNSGSAAVTATGGNGSYTYAWSTSPVQTAASVSGLKAGSYTVSVTDNSGCAHPSSTILTITEPANALSAAITSQTNILCKGGSNGAATVTAGGGSLGYHYSWSTSPVQQAPAATGLSAGTYTATVTDNNGCPVPATATVSISEPALLSGTTSKTDVLCHGGNTGTASVHMSGGTSPYSYLWSNGQTCSAATGLISGTYSVAITDAHGCAVSSSATVGEPSALTAAVNVLSNVKCNGGNSGVASVTPSGGKAPYAYLWSNGAVSSATNGLFAGNYNVQVTDANGCTSLNFFAITEPAALKAGASQTNVSCHGAANGAASISVTGGTPGYSYLWSGGQTASSIANLPAGSYSATATDANGCTIGALVNITEPAVLSASASNTNVSCNGGSNGTAGVHASGGTAPYTYHWNNGQTGALLINISAGTYSVAVADANGCSITASITVAEPPALTLTTTAAGANCNGGNDGTASVSVSGGTPSYTYLWSNNQTTFSATGLSAGAYTVLVTDANGCSQTASLHVGQQTPVVLSSRAVSPLCYGDHNGSLSLNASGGTAPYAYLWSNGATTQNLSDVTAGTYIVHVTDGKQCGKTDTIVITQPDSLNAAAAGYVYPNGYNVYPYGSASGRITLDVHGGTPAYQYHWSNGSTTQSPEDLIAGVYTVTVTDAHGCTYTVSLNLKEPDDLAMPSAVSPNNDGFNDYFVVRGLDVYPDNHIEIFNRWGDLVFSKDNYRNDWYGQNQKGETLPDATYFVILKVKTFDATKMLTGYVDVRK